MLFSETKLGFLLLGVALSAAASRDQESSSFFTTTTSTSKKNVLVSREGAAAAAAPPSPRRKEASRGSVRGAASPPPPPHHHNSEDSPARPIAPSHELGAPNASPSRHVGTAGGEDHNNADIISRRRLDVGVDVSLEPSDAMRQREASDEALTISVGTASPTISGASPDDVNRCSEFNLSKFGMGRECGAPLSSPCFDLSRCANGPSIYVYDYKCTLADSKDLPTRNHELDDKRRQDSHWREAALDAGVLAETYEEACMFIHVNAHAHDQPCATVSPLWNEGRNHIMMEFTDWSRDMRPIISNSYAMEGASNEHTCYYRSEFDMSVPLPPNVVFPEIAHILPLDREYFLTFKGTLYLGGHGFEQRLSLASLHDEASGVIVGLKCFELHDEQLLPENYDFCQMMGARNDAFDYTRLMNCTFGLVPGGRSPGTYRLGEVMSAGAIPVFVVRDWVRPFREQIDWPSFSFIFTPDEVETVMLPTLRAVTPEKLKEMQRLSLEAYWKIFGGATDFSVVARNTVDQLAQRLRHH